jgi:hypothetical protein
MLTMPLPCNMNSVTFRTSPFLSGELCCVPFPDLFSINNDYMVSNAVSLYV